MSRGGTDKKRRQLPAPARLVAQRFESAEGEYVLFSWTDSWTDEAPSAPRTAPALSAAEKVVLAELVRGASNREIAGVRRVSERTIANQVASILRKLGARSRFELIRSYAGA